MVLRRLCFDSMGVASLLELQSLSDTSALLGSVSSVGKGNNGSGFGVIMGGRRGISTMDVSSLLFFEQALITTNTNTSTTTPHATAMTTRLVFV